MNNLLSYIESLDARIRASYKDLPLQAKLFTQNFQAATNTQQSPQPTIKQPSPNSTRPSLFKKTFSPIFKGQLISKCLFGVIILTKMAMKIL